MEIRKANLEEVLALRHKILRPGRPIESAFFQGDEEATHWGLWDQGVLQAVLSVFSSDNFKGKRAVQLRGMAVNTEQQRRGYGREILQRVLHELAIGETEILWCNARTNALPFYQKMGFNILGEEFVIPDVGPHYKMYINLKQRG